MNHETQQANGLPAGWVWTTLGDATEVILGQSPPSSTYNSDGIGLPFFQGKAEFGDLYPTVVKWCSEPAKIAQANDVLISVRAPVGPTNLCPERCCIGRGLAAIRTVGQMPCKYVLYYLRFIEDEWDSKATGTTFKAISGDTLRREPFPLAPLPEQHRIVAEIETQFTRLDAGVAALKRVQAALRRYKASVLKAACEGRLVPNEAELARVEGRAYEPASALLERILAERRVQWQQANSGKRYVEPKGVDGAGLAELPEGWVWAKLDQLLVELKNGYFGGRPEAEPPGIPILRVSAVRPMSVSFDDPRYLLDVDETKQAAYLINEGDLFFTRYNGSRNLVGACGLVRHAPFAALYPDKLIRALVLKDLVLPGYLEAYFNTDAARDYIEGQAKTTAGQYGIAGGELRQATVALPPLSEQHRIFAEVERRLSVAQEVEGAVAAGLRRAERLRQSILKQAFAGRLTPQDLNDGPASALFAHEVNAHGTNNSSLGDPCRIGV
jgi:type I restriction enzyme S subunit